MKPTPGRIVLYRLSENDVKSINRRRADARESRIARDSSGAQVHVGNHAIVGDVVPAMVIRVWHTGINAQAFLDGNDTIWVTSRDEGDEPGTWSWPPRA